MKIYFGRVPEGYSTRNMDEFFKDVLVKANYSYDEAVKSVFELYDKVEIDIKRINSEIVFWTCNPMILQYLDEEHRNLVYFIDQDNNEIHFMSDPICQEKYEWMDVGEALIDDSRVLN
jgi:hypothetical protein